MNNKKIIVDLTMTFTLNKKIYVINSDNSIEKEYTVPFNKVIDSITDIYGKSQNIKEIALKGARIFTSRVKDNLMKKIDFTNNDCKIILDK